MQSTLTREVVEQPSVETPPPRGKEKLRRSGRSAVLWGLATFILLQAGLRLLIDHSMPTLRDPRFEIKAAQFEKAVKRAAAKGQPLTVCMLGTSVTAHAFNSKLIEERLRAAGHANPVVYNMSDFGTSPMTHLMYVRKLVERDLRPDVVLVEIFPLVFRSPGPPIDVDLWPAHRMEYNDLDILEKYSKDPKLRRQWWEARLVPGYGHRLALLTALAPILIPYADRLETWKQFDQNGWVSMRPRTNEELEKARQFVTTTFADLQTYAPGKPTVRALDELLAFLHEQKIAAALIQMPTGPTMRGLFRTDGIDELNRTVRSLSRKYDIPVLDAYTWLGEDMFTDSYHANRDGAEIFSERMTAELLLPLLQEKKTSP